MAFPNLSLIRSTSGTDPCASESALHGFRLRDAVLGTEQGDRPGPGVPGLRMLPERGVDVAETAQEVGFLVRVAQFPAQPEDLAVGPEPGGGVAGGPGDGAQG